MAVYEHKNEIKKTKEEFTRYGGFRSPDNQGSYWQ